MGHQAQPQPDATAHQLRDDIQFADSLRRSRGFAASISRIRYIHSADALAVTVRMGGDEVGDGDEYFLDMNPRRRDTDDDGLLDNLELGFGSDPTHGNVDDDGYTDQEEYERRSDPLAYDLTRGEAVGAFLGGATAGDSERLARRLGLGDAQLQSPEYLVGQVASGFIGFGDVRDIAAGVGTGDLVGAAVAAVGLAPLGGDAAKTGVTLTKFAKRGERAERSADALVERLPWSTSTKEKVRRKMFGSAVRLPTILKGGPQDNTVYKGVGYIGITSDFPRRKYEHATAGRTFSPEEIAGATGLSRGQARAIEEACIVELGRKVDGGTLANQRHSIDPRLPYHEEAITWAQEFLRQRGGTCGGESYQLFDRRLGRRSDRTRPKDDRIRYRPAEQQAFEYAGLHGFTFESAVRRIPVRRWLGLTATPYRRDGRNELTYQQCGPVSWPLKGDRRDEVLAHSLNKRARG